MSKKNTYGRNYPSGNIQKQIVARRITDKTMSDSDKSTTRVRYGESVSEAMDGEGRAHMVDLEHELLPPVFGNDEWDTR